MTHNRRLVSDRGRRQAGAIELVEHRLGHGPPLVVLHGEDGLLFAAPFLQALAEQFSVRAPVHPGWGGTSPAAEVASVDDLSYVYLDYFASLPEPVSVVGISLGAWVAADVAIKDSSAFSSLTLVAPLGIKISDRHTRDFVDIYACPAEDVSGALYGAGPRPDLRGLDHEEFEQLAAAQEMVARLAWKPYLHDPKLRQRLARIGVPTLVAWGTDDGLVLRPADYYRAWAVAIGANAEARSLPGSHRLEEQCPGQLATMVGEFVRAGATDLGAKR